MPPRSPVMDMGLCNWSEIRISYLGHEPEVATPDIGIEDDELYEIDPTLQEWEE